MRRQLCAVGQWSCEAMKEIWKDIKGYEGIYQVSSLGRVRSNRNRFFGESGWKLMSIATNKKRYPKLVLHKDGKRKNFDVHRLVAEAFIPNPEGLEYVNHISENTSDNRVENLEWCTASYNSSYCTSPERRQISAIRNGSKKAKRALLQFSKDGKFIRGFESAHEAARELCACFGNIISCANGSLKSAYGFIWKHAF